MTQTVIVPTDFSNNARIAARYAIQLAKTLKLKVHVLHAYRPFSSAFQSSSANQSDDQQAREKAEKELADFIDTIGPVSGVPTGSAVIKGSLLEGVTRYIDNNEVCLVVMGAHGASEVRRDLLGSNTYDVAKEVSKPLLVVPQDSREFDLQQVVFFTDYQHGDVKTLKSLETVFGDLRFAINLVHIYPNSPVLGENDDLKRDEKLADWKAMLERDVPTGGIVTELVEGEEGTGVVNETLKRLNADIALLTLISKKGFFSKLLTRSLARTIVLNPTVPVLLTSEGTR